MIIHSDQKGRSKGGKFTWRSQTEYEPDDYPEDSVYWRNWRDLSANELIKKIGDDAFQDWVETNLTDDDSFKSAAKKFDKCLLDMFMAQARKNLLG